MKKHHQLSVPIVQQDLTHEETIVQIAYSLEVLGEIVTNLFTNIEGAIEKKKKRLYNIQCRCDDARNKVEKLSNIKKSIKVYSSYKYPGPRSELFFKDPLHTVIESKELNVKVKCAALSLDKFSLKEKLKFYHVRDSAQTLKKNTEIIALEGLGEFPSTSKLNSVLLYNTNQNLYSHYKLLDPLKVIGKQHEPLYDEAKKTIAEPDPISITSNDFLGYKNIHNYCYSPAVQDVPDINAPLNLPRLTGIAGDLEYNSQQIVKEESPIVRTDHDGSENELPPKSNNTTENLTTSGPTLPADLPVPQSLLPPPPPPPPPPPLQPNEFQQDKSDHKTINATSAVSTDVRANLMEAIRQAGGKSKLKHVHNDKPAKTKINQSNNNLMDDLHEKLHMRRKGISGKIDNTDGMIDRIVAMIPPPPPPIKNQTEDDDEDWDD